MAGAKARELSQQRVEDDNRSWGRNSTEVNVYRLQPDLAEHRRNLQPGGHYRMLTSSLMSSSRASGIGIAAADQKIQNSVYAEILRQLQTRDTLTTSGLETIITESIESKGQAGDENLRAKHQSLTAESAHLDRLINGLEATLRQVKDTLGGAVPASGN